MVNKLYVTNVPVDVTEEALRRHFATCGGVSEVEIMVEPRSGRPRGIASVTMTSPAFATTAVDRLDGVAFEGRTLRVSTTPTRAADAGPPPPRVKIVQQFRERGNMAYDLDCAGVPLTLRIFEEEGSRWRIDARSTEAADAIVVAGRGTTRAEALGDVVQRWNERTDARVAPLDGEGLVTALRAVRAI